MGAAIPYPDLQYTIEYIQTYGPPLGLNLSLQKCNFLISTNVNSPLPFLSLPHRAILTWITDTFSNQTEKTTGIRILGAPIGNKTFCNEFQQETISKIQQNLSLIEKYVPDSQSCFALYTHCVSTQANHLLSADTIIHPPSTPFRSQFRTNLQ